MKFAFATEILKIETLLMRRRFARVFDDSVARIFTNLVPRAFSLSHKIGKMPWERGCIFTCFCREGCESSSKNCQPGTLQGGCSNSTNLQEALRFMSYRFYVGMIVLKRRNEESDGSISWKRNVQSKRERERERERESRQGVRRFVLRFSNQMISFNAWIFMKRKGFSGLRGLRWPITVFKWLCLILHNFKTIYALAAIFCKSQG